MDILVSTQWLADHICAPDLRILDATLFLPGTGRDAAEDYAAAHIPGAGFLNLPTLCDPDHPAPGMLPPDAMFTDRLQALGVDADSRIIVYDNSPTHSAARAWWMLTIYGVGSAVAILDGGMIAWVAEGRPTESGTPAFARGNAQAKKDAATVRTKADMIANVASCAEQVLDARAAGRFTGAEKEPREGMASGHIPGSMNLPSSSMFGPDNRMLRGEALRAAFDRAGIAWDKPLITTCGSGVTAAIMLAGAQLLGKNDVALYDGSWSEWGVDPETPKATSAA